jgi:CheY-like chemotaxis protein
VSRAEQTVLVIDDDPAFAEFVAAIVESVGCRAIIATNGMDGLRLAREFSPGLILCDLVMPGVGGDEVLQELRDDPATSELVRVLMSGHGCPDLRVIPADAFIAKPVSTHSLRRLVCAFARPAASMRDSTPDRQIA